MSALSLPPLFHKMHARTMERYYLAHGSVFNVVPIEPLGAVDLNMTADCTATMVTVRAVNENGSLRFEANSYADLAAAIDWAVKHKDTTPEQFAWLPFGRSLT